MLLDPNYCAQWPTFDQFRFVGFIQIPMLLLEISIDVPGIPSFGFVVESLEQVSASKCRGTAAISFGGSKRFGICLLIDEAGDASALRVNF